MENRKRERIIEAGMALLLVITLRSRTVRKDSGCEESGDTGSG